MEDTKEDKALKNVAQQEGTSVQIPECFWLFSGSMPLNLAERFDLLHYTLRCCFSSILLAQ